jgi:hypothetical protein
VGVVSELSEQVPPTSNVSLTGGEDAERGDIEDMESDAQKYTIRHDLDFVEFSRGDDTVRKGAGRSFLGVPMLSDEDLKTTPAFVAREIYSLAHKCPVRTADHGTFSATDGTKGYPTTIVCDPETFKPCAPDGHANITGRSNTETQDKYNPGSAHNVLSVLTKGPHISLDGIARKRADGTTRTREEISQETLETLQEAGFTARKCMASNDTFRPYATVQVWLAGDDVVAQALILFLSLRSVPVFPIHSNLGTIEGCPAVRIPCYHPRTYAVMLNEQAMRMDSPGGETAQEAMEWVGGLFRREVVDWRQA